ncbi:MAG TPA: shikimate kinase [Flavobacteriales bacterium]|nr:shikimate kinase [Flavobacteriales bacterium]
MSTKPICLLGFMGAGKSRWGKLLANRLKLAFVDLDNTIELKAGMPVPQIFMSHRETYFRKLETELLKELLDQNDLVISLGGGTPCSDENIKMLKEKALTVYLKLNAGMLHSRLISNYKRRPLLAKHKPKDLLKVITDLLAQREKYYNQADVIIEVEKLTIEKLAVAVQTR